ncbi:hypothetical protein [Microbacterium sp. H1-D42]|uniref:hypothetical protein n=1 Tax=Microbacterium sp. H1-D42 TaxID=2925844 RepID=UPI001F532C0C|nr:hypothetical protein [Microbacterium sp. H1-D42]UNK69350.1 hypothetical protein MNR00_09105 [Microbacterium sp. H1-D42]
MATGGALVVGDPGRSHLRLTPEAVIIREGAENGGILAWGSIEQLSIDVPTTRFRLPGFLGTVLLGALAVITMADPGVEPDDGSAHITADGETRTLSLSRHHLGGYWAPTVIGANRLIAHLIANPDQQALLAHPERLVELAARLARATAV